MHHYYGRVNFPLSFQGAGPGCVLCPAIHPSLPDPGGLREPDGGAGGGGAGPLGALLPPAGPPAQAHLLSLWVWGQGTHGKGEYGCGVAIRGHAAPGKIFI